MATHKWEDNHECRSGLPVIPKKWGVQASRWAPPFRILHQKDQLPKHLALKSSGACMQQSQRERETPISKSAHKIWHALSPSEEGVIWKEPESDLFADLRELFHCRRQLRLPLGTQMLVGVILGSLFYHEDTGAHNYYFWVFFLAY